MIQAGNVTEGSGKLFLLLVVSVLVWLFASAQERKNALKERCEEKDGVFAMGVCLKKGAVIP